MPLQNKYKSITIARLSAGDTFSPLTWTDISDGGDVGYIQPVGGNETFQHGKSGEDVQYRMFAPTSNTAIIYGDKITQDSQSYVVLWQNQITGISAEGHHKEILMGLFK